jgi:hypothetical protein
MPGPIFFMANRQIRKKSPKGEPRREDAQKSIFMSSRITDVAFIQFLHQTGIVDPNGLERLTVILQRSGDRFRPMINLSTVPVGDGLFELTIGIVSTFEAKETAAHKKKKSWPTKYQMLKRFLGGSVLLFFG